MEAESGAPRTADEVREFFTSWIGAANAGEWDAFGNLMHPDIVLHDPMTAEPAVGRGAALPRAQQQYEPFPDGRIEMLGGPFVATDEPELAYRWRFTGTNLRPVSPPGFAATGEQVRVDGASILRFRDGKVAEVQLYFDTTDIARQLLAAPPAGSRLEAVIALGQRLRVWLRSIRS